MPNWDTKIDWDLATREAVLFVLFENETTERRLIVTHSLETAKLLLQLLMQIGRPMTGNWRRIR